MIKCVSLKIFFITLFFSFNTSLLFSTNGADDKYIQQADSLLSLLTLEEKAGQMTNIGLTALMQGAFWTDADTLLLDTANMKELLLENHVGSVQNKGVYPPCTEEWHRIIKSVQDYVIENSQHQIPILFGMDGVHGANYTAGSTLFPHQIALAASWNPELARITGEITAYELRASSLPWNYAPVLDVTWQPLWGRIFETFGEDTYMNSVMGEAFVKGSQGESLSDNTSVAVCLKHFIGYGMPMAGKDRGSAIIPERYLRQYHIEPYRRAIEQGAISVMLNSGTVNGIPGHADEYLITDVLKDELGFKGLVISDWEDISRLAEVHNVAPDSREAAKIAVMAGLDISMVPYDASFAEHIVDLVGEGEIPMSRIDDAVRRILFVKFKLNLFEEPYTHPDNYPDFGSEKYARKSYEAALETATLLKNQDDILPLEEKGSKILVTGPTAHALTALNGPWSRTWAGNDPTYDDPDKKTFFQAMKAVYGEDNVVYTPGTGYEDGFIEDKEHLMGKAEETDIIFVCVGEEPLTEKPSDINDLTLPANQIELIEILHESGKPVVLVMLQGRPRIIREAEPLSKAVIHAYWPGHEGGRALASLISGQENFSGKLPYTYPRYTGSFIPYQHKGSDKLDVNFEMDGFNPQWEFGHGLSYTQFEFSNVSFSADTVNTGDDLKVSVEVTNTGDKAGKEVVQLFIRDLVASIAPDDRKLIGFDKIYLEPNETKVVELPVHYDDLKYVGVDNEWIAERGAFEILIGGGPANRLTKRFFYTGNQ
ncbi:MAG: glycoside hydrolase family 3 N-terminal domain-containing protein [Bacteroidales bacterium]